MGEAGRDEDLAQVVLGELDGNVAAEGGRATTDVDGDVEDAAPEDTHELGLGGGGDLEVQPAHCARISGHGLVVLHPGTGNARGPERPFVEGLGKIPPGVTVTPDLNQFHFGEN